MRRVQAYALLGPEERGTLTHIGGVRVAIMAVQAVQYLDTRGEMGAQDSLVCMQLLSMLVRRSAPATPMRDSAQSLRSLA